MVIDIYIYITVVYQSQPYILKNDIFLDEWPFYVERYTYQLWAGFDPETWKFEALGSNHRMPQREK